MLQFDSVLGANFILKKRAKLNEKLSSVRVKTIDWLRQMEVITKLCPIMNSKK